MCERKLMDELAKARIQLAAARWELQQTGRAAEELAMASSLALCGLQSLRAEAGPESDHELFDETIGPLQAALAFARARDRCAVEWPDAIG